MNDDPRDLELEEKIKNLSATRRKRNVKLRRHKEKSCGLIAWRPRDPDNAALRLLAEHLGCSISALLDRFVRHGLKRARDNGYDI